MTTIRNAADILDNDFLDIRHGILDIAAALDRIDRATGKESAITEPRMEQIRQALAVLAEPETNRAQRVQMTFSRPYDPNWRP